MDQGAQVCKKFGRAKRQKVKNEETLKSSLKDEATGVEHLLTKPKTENLLVDDILCFGGLEFTNPIGHHDFGLGYVFDGLLDQVEEVDDIHAANDISGACEDFLLDFELAEKSPNLYFVQSERTQPDTSSLESQSPAASGIDSGALELSESSTLNVLAYDYKNWPLEKTVKSVLTEEVHDDLKPSGNRLFSQENERQAIRAITGKRILRPTKRYIEEFSTTKTKHVKMSQNDHIGIMHDNDTVDSLSNRRTYNTSEEDSCCEGVTRSFEDFEVSLDEKLWSIVKTRNLSSNGLEEKHLKIKYQDELHHTTNVNLQSCTENGVQGPPQRRRGRAEKSVAQILKSNDEWTGSDSEDGCIKRRTYKRRKSTCYDDRRKHHRSWTLSEVIKLVDGIAEYGTGRWTDIKNHMFTSSGYRTPVDLRDKWRNLLKASRSYKGISKLENEVKQGFKHGIPSSVLHRVGELAAIHPYPRFSPGGRYIRRKN